MNKIKRLFITAVLLAALFTLFIIAVFCIPTSAVRENVEKSAVQIERDGLWYKPFGFYLFQIDNMTDCLMLRINATADSDRPVRAAMMAEQYDSVGDSLHPYNTVVSSTKTIAKTGRKEGYEYVDYARYWHGYQVLLRPMLTVFSYHSILTINYICLMLLALAVCLAAYRRIGAVFALTLAASLVLTNFFIVPLALQFSTCYYIAFAAMAFILCRPRFADGDGCRCDEMFFITGAVTAYMDFLTTPVLTLGMPLVTLLAMRARRNAYRYQPATCRPMYTTVAASVSWLAGYALLWAAKWAIAWVLTGENVFGSAIENARLRIGNTIVYGGREILLTDFVQGIMETVCSRISVWGMVAAMMLTAAATILYIYKHKQKTRQYGWLLVVAAMPVAWFAVMKNHSLQHIFFTWRDFLLSVWCVILYLCLTLRKTKAI